LIVAIVVVHIWAALGTEFSFGKLISGVPRFFELASGMVPPDVGVLEVSAMAIVETIQIAILGTTLGFSMALVLGILSAGNIAPQGARVVCRFILNLIRTIPAIIWALLFVAAVGLGPFPGVLGVAMYSTGFLGKLLYEGFETVDKEQVDAIKATGASRLQTIRFGVFPQALPMIFSHLLYMFEYNVRASAIVGLVGAGGVGFYLMIYTSMFQWSKVGMVLLLLLITVIVIDWISGRIRAKFV
jgi:phosphonate transport system permease protein